MSYVLEGGIVLSLRCIASLFYKKGAFPLSKAGDKSTALGIIPLFSKLNIPSPISFSVIGGGSAKGSSLKNLGNILFG